MKRPCNRRTLPGNGTISEDFAVLLGRATLAAIIAAPVVASFFWN